MIGHHHVGKLFSAVEELGQTLAVVLGRPKLGIKLCRQDLRLDFTKESPKNDQMSAKRIHYFSS